MKKVKVIILVFVVLVMASCSAKKKVTTTVVPDDPVSTDTAKVEVVIDNGKEELKANAAKIEKVITTAESFIGKPYCFGGVGPNCFDCSGFTQTAFKAAGVELARMAGGQADKGKTITKIEDLKRGDLVFFTKTWATTETITHVGICTEPMKMLHAPSAGYTIMYANLSYDYWRKHFLYGKRLFKVE